jgi:hypothetical protein
MVHSLVVSEFGAVGEPLYRVIEREGRQLLMYSARVSEESSHHPGDAAASWARALVKSCGTIVWPWWPKSWREEEYCLYIPWRRREFARMCQDAIRRGSETIICEEPVRFPALDALVTSLWSVRDLDAFERELVHLDAPSRLSLRWVYLVGFSDCASAWTVLQADDPSLVDAVLAEANSDPTFKVKKRHPAPDRGVES